MQFSLSSLFDVSMSFQSIGTAGIGLLLIIFIYRSFTGTKLPPGPLAWPLVGNLPLMGPQPHRSFMDLSKKYGPLMSMQLGSFLTILVQDAEMARIVLKTQDQICCTRPHLVTGELFTGCQGILFSPLNSTFKVLRKACASSLFTPKRIQQLQETRKETQTAFLQKLLQESRGGKAALVDRAKLTEMNFNNLSVMLYGKSYSNYKFRIKNADGSFHEREIHEIGDEWPKLVGGVMIGDYLPFLRKADFGGHEAQLKQLREVFITFLTGIMEEHKQNPVGAGPDARKEDFVDLLLSLPPDEDGIRLTETQIKAALQDLTFGAVDTTTTQVQWTLTELMRNPDVKKKVQDEMDAVVGKDRMIEESDLVRLPYFKAMVKESLRLHPAVALLAPHVNMSPMKIACYDIPKGTRLLVSIYSIHMSPDIWPEPLKFNPERFLDPQQAANLKSDDFKFIPFGAGRRMCPGFEFGMRSVESTVATLLHTCDLSLPQGMKPMDVNTEESLGVTLTKTTPLEIVFTPRLPLKLYAEAGLAP